MQTIEIRIKPISARIVNGEKLLTLRYQRTITVEGNATTMHTDRTFNHAQGLQFFKHVKTVLTLKGLRQYRVDGKHGKYLYYTNKTK